MLHKQHKKTCVCVCVYERMYMCMNKCSVCVLKYYIVVFNYFHAYY